MLSKHLAVVNAIKVLRGELLAKLPSREKVISSSTSLTIDLESPYPAQHQRLTDLVAAADYDSIVREFSVRDSGF